METSPNWRKEDAARPGCDCWLMVKDFCEDCRGWEADGIAETASVVGIADCWPGSVLGGGDTTRPGATERVRRCWEGIVDICVLAVNVVDDICRRSRARHHYRNEVVWVMLAGVESRGVERSGQVPLSSALWLGALVAKTVTEGGE